MVGAGATFFPIGALEEMVNIGTLFAFVLVSVGVVILRRTRYINSAIALCTTSALLTALVVTLLFASEFTRMSVGGVIAVMFVGAMVCLSTAFIMFLIEVRIAIKSLRIGVHKND